MPPKRYLTREQKEERASEFVRDYQRVMQDFEDAKSEFLHRAESLKPSTVDQVTARERLAQRIAEA